MTKAMHTPGPWYVSRSCTPQWHPNGDRSIAVCTNAGPFHDPLKYPFYADPTPEEDAPRLVAMANARLITAAPELLVALKKVLEDGHDDFGVGRDAIAKATGSEAA